MNPFLSVSPGPDAPQPLVLYHGRSCPDGFAAALAAWIYFEGRAEFRALDHGDVRSLTDLPDLGGRDVYILDFSFGPELMQAIDQTAARLVLLDHHLSAAQALAGFASRNGVVHFDLGRSGARLAWEFFFPGQAVPDLVRHVEDRDIWVWRHPESASFLAALDMEPFDFARWHSLAQLTGEALADYIARGQAMDAKFQQLARDMLPLAQPLVFNGVAGWMANVPSAFHSQVGDLLCQRCDTFALLWTADKPGVVKCGLRSRSGFNCIPLAQSLGGGGHAQACGFKLPVSRLPELLSGRLQA